MLAEARQRGAGIDNLTFLHADARAIPLPDDAVDLGFGTWAIGAIWPPAAKKRAMAEIHRVLKSGDEIRAVEIQWQSEFMDLRGPEEQANDLQTVRWYASHGFSWSMKSRVPVSSHRLPRPSACSASWSKRRRGSI